jgi:hypothetical protein
MFEWRGIEVLGSGTNLRFSGSFSGISRSFSGKVCFFFGFAGRDNRRAAYAQEEALGLGGGWWVKDRGDPLPPELDFDVRHHGIPFVWPERAKLELGGPEDAARKVFGGSSGPD